MSGGNHPEKCPNCGAEDALDVYSDYKPFSYSIGKCLECGFYFNVVTGQMTLQEINDQRDYLGEDILKRRRKGHIDPDLKWEDI